MAVLDPDARDARNSDTSELNGLFGAGMGKGILTELRSDAHVLIEQRGRRTRELLLQYVSHRGFELDEAPAAAASLTPPPQPSAFVGRDKELHRLETLVQKPRRSLPLASSIIAGSGALLMTLFFAASPRGAILGAAGSLVASMITLLAGNWLVRRRKRWSHRPVVISRMPGMGKTSLVADFVQRHARGTVWFSSEATIETQLRLLLEDEPRCIVCDGLEGGAEGEQKVQLVRQRFPRSALIITTNDPGLFQRIAAVHVALEPSRVVSIAIMRHTIGNDRYAKEEMAYQTLAEALQDHPLAIRQISLMMADNQALAATQVLDRLDEFKNTLATGNELSPVYNSCLLAFMRLTDDYRRALVRLSSFGERTFAAEVVRTVCAIEPFGFTTSLCRQGLLQFAGNGRWILHTMVAQSVRAYAFRTTDTMFDVFDAQLRSNAYYLSLLERFAAEINETQSRLSALALIRAELHNVIAIPDSVAQIKRALSTAGVVSPAQDDLGQLIARAALQLSALSSEFWLSGLSQVLFRAARSIEAVCDERVVAAILELAATSAFQEGKFEEAEATFHSAAAAFERLGEKRALASLLNNWGLCLAEAEKYEDAVRHLDRALSINKEESDEDAPRRIAHNETNLAEICSRRKNLQEARAHLLRALEADRDLSKPQVVERLGNLAIIEFGCGDLREAERIFADAFGRFAAMEYLPPGIMLLIDNAGRLHRDQGLRAVAVFRYFMVAVGFAQTLFAGHIYASKIPRGPRLEQLVRESIGDVKSCNCAVCKAMSPLRIRCENLVSKRGDRIQRPR